MTMDHTGKVYVLATAVHEDENEEPRAVFATERDARDFLADQLLVERYTIGSASLSTLPFYGDQAKARPRFDIGEAAHVLWQISRSTGPARSWHEVSDAEVADLMLTVRSVLAAALGIDNAELPTAAILVADDRDQ